MLEGLPPNDATRLLRLLCGEAQARAAADAIVETFDPAETAAAAFEVEGSGSAGSRSWTVDIYFGEGVDEGRLRARVADVLGRAAADAATVETIDRRDWVATSLAGLAPVRAGRFVIHGRHDRDGIRPNELALEIEAALAFGTGHHGTTRGCLLAFDRVLKARRPRRILDLGTGTGVLAMAAARVTKRPVRCGDLDFVAVRTAANNARTNGLGHLVRPVMAAGLAHPRLRAGAPYDLVFANILAKPLRALAPAVAGTMRAGADLILSGLLARDVPGIVAAYTAQGFAKAARIDLDGWVTLSLRKRR